MRIVKVMCCVLIVLGLAIGVVYAVNRVGDLNSHASVLETCLKAQPNGLTSRITGCPLIASTGEISSIHREANTLGALGWMAFFVLVFGVGGTVLDIITDFKEPKAKKQSTP